MFILILELIAIPCWSLEVYSTHQWRLQVLGQFSAGRDSRILTNGDVKEGDIMERVDEAMINRHTQHGVGFEVGAYSTYGSPFHSWSDIMCARNSKVLIPDHNVCEFWLFPECKWVFVHFCDVTALSFDDPEDRLAKFYLYRQDMKVKTFEHPSHFLLHAC